MKSTTIEANVRPQRGVRMALCASAFVSPLVPFNQGLMVEIAKTLADNVDRVRERISRAADSAGRAADSVKLVSVTKYVDAATAAVLLDAGCVDLGESRPQALWAKAAEPSLANANWHLVGHLQRNKVKRTLPLVDLVHSIDSERLLDALDSGCRQTPDRAESTTFDVLLEVNCSGEIAKHGFAPDEVRETISRLELWPRLRIRGLMTMASLGGGLGAARRQFGMLRELRDELQRLAPPGTQLDELSMGMSRDFEEAIAEGATIVRLGTILFQGIG